jgi:hypothetical protein
MGFPQPTAGNYPGYNSGDAVKYTPKVYSKKLLVKFYDKTVFGEIAMRDYEGEIKAFGDTVIIRTRPDVAISDYTRNMDLNAARKFYEPQAIELQINRAKFYSVGLDAIDEAQFDISALDTWATDASESMGLIIDQDVLANVYSQVDAANTGNAAGKKWGGYVLGTSGAPITVTKANILDYIAYMSSVLSEQAVPEDGNRWLVIPEVVASRLNTSDLRSSNFNGDGANAVLRNGRIGEIAGFKIYKSNNLPVLTGTGVNSVYPLMFGHKSSIAFASQLVKNRKLELQNTFGSAMEGLQVFGYKVINPKYMGYAAAKVA